MGGDENSQHLQGSVLQGWSAPWGDLAGESWSVDDIAEQVPEVRHQRLATASGPMAEAVENSSISAEPGGPAGDRGVSQGISLLPRKNRRLRWPRTIR